ncbi:RGS1-HXK1-interacting protein 1 isoform X2 [Arachis stenosperma]|uniref:RGS1-HXK1-interacting protein 1 isoform X2 n=1 Tax=Arachis stenosperma TaxID=217475 RepID=UPI0025AD3550|nr:RGS1-HXK1-interacting protein 1 isoform X2 [Arachis stenosperma]
MAEIDSSLPSASPPADASPQPLPPPSSEFAQSSLASLAENLQRSAIESARTVHHNSSNHIRTFQDFLPDAVSQYRDYENAFFNKVKDGVVVARENPALGAGFAISAALLLMRGPRRFLYRNTLGRFQSEEYATVEKGVRDLNISVDFMKKESKKLLERAALAERDMKYGRTELMSAGTQYQQLAKSLYKVEARANDLMDRLREIPTREALALRAEVASLASSLKKQKFAVDKRIMKISELGVAI